MRSIEMASTILNVLLLGWILFARNKTQRGLLIGFGASAIVVLAHAFIEGMRWQMIPVYALTLLPILVLAGRRLFKPRKEKDGYKKRPLIRWISTIVLATLYSAIAIALPILLPIFTFEQPTGPYKVGTVTYDWKDEQREETFTSEPGDPRELMVQIWYPADSQAKGHTASYITNADVFAEGYSTILNLPKVLFTTFGYVKTHAIESAELSQVESTYPVLLFSHGFSGHKNQNTFQVEELASHGYIVVGIDHTYSSTASVFADGRVAPYVQQDLNSPSYLDQANAGWVEDAKFVLDQVERLANDDPDNRFTGRLDLQNVGMFGHSFGGATSTQMLMEDERIKAAMNLDGVLYGKQRIPAGGLAKPFLMMSADGSLNSVQQIQEPELRQMMEGLLARYEHVAEGGNYWMKVNHMTHMGFTDLYLLSPLFERMEGVDVRQAHRLINAYSLDFFNHYLKRQPLQLLEQNIGEYPDFTLQKD
ncbi:acetylhydrolase [Paenibacillus sp. 79R4]|uniref:alpha/beta hydrolase family protein n=1 Tax=Paenibacillus sp. 79R4 TaxID=2212847 RepID=UPI0015BD13B2|nr:alpha/beta fold hydrolase [Paenibacillus sp. 79R4]NWL88568.1 acetylhydrolase [Paenibacillus sp. 79R4]